MNNQKLIQELESEILKHKNLYYHGKSQISDEDYDALEDRLRSLNPESYVLDIVGPTFFQGEKIAHKTKMLSLRKTYKIEELLQWRGDEAIVSTFKIDGSSCSLIYENGRLELAKTRGDGQFGEKITNKVFYINDIPKAINENESFEIRGEIFCREKNFIRLAHEMDEKGLEKPTSQRNIVAGILGRKENIELARHLSFQAFEFIGEEGVAKSEEEKFHYLQRLGFKTPEFYVNTSVSEIKVRINEAKEFMAEGDYLIDGLVFSYNDIKLHDRLGYTAHHPRYKMAYKFQGEVKDTKIKEIKWQVSRNGTLTPVAVVDEVELSGARVNRVTLHNFGMVKEFNLKRGDIIKIVRSGEVIPKFIDVVMSENVPFEYPSLCPSCCEPTFIDDIRLVCRNSNCKDKIKDEILNFIKKIGIENLSDKRLDDLIEAGLVRNIKSLYALKINDLLGVDKIKEKLAQKIIDSIDKSKNVDLVTFLSSLGISGGAYNKCEKIVSHGFNTIEKVMNLEVSDLEGIEGFAEISANEFHRSLQAKKDLIRDLIGLGFEIENKVQVSHSKINGLKFCVTGTLTMKRSKIQELISNNGGVFVSSVTQTTDYLITNDIESESSKFKKAKKYGTKIINEERFKELIRANEKE